MAQQHGEARGLRDVRPAVGTFVLTAALVAVAGVVLAGRAQGWFEPTLTVRTVPVPFPADSTLGLQDGAEVQILGNTAGTVTNVAIELDPAAAAASRPAAAAGGGRRRLRLRVTLRLRGPHLHLVRQDSRVIVQRKFGVAGSAYVQITPGRGDPATPDTPLECQVTRDLTRVVEETIAGLNRPDGPLQQSLANVQALTAKPERRPGDGRRLLADEPTAASLQATLANVEKLTSVADQGRGMAGRLLTDAEAGRQLADSMKSLNESLASLNEILARSRSADVAKLMEQVGQTLGKVDAALVEVTATTADLRRQTRDLPGLLGETQEMMRQTTRMIEGAQRTWLLRDYVAPEGSTRLSPADATAR
jgi:phospholipid/cholesterol/gamma-HCH transport system substrate-binding protein